MPTAPLHTSTPLVQQLNSVLGVRKIPLLPQWTPQGIDPRAPPGTAVPFRPLVVLPFAALPKEATEELPACAFKAEETERAGYSLVLERSRLNGFLRSGVNSWPASALPLIGRERMRSLIDEMQFVRDAAAALPWDMSTIATRWDAAAMLFGGLNRSIRYFLNLNLMSACAMLCEAAAALCERTQQKVLEHADTLLPLYRDQLMGDLAALFAEADRSAPSESMPALYSRIAADAWLSTTLDCADGPLLRYVIDRGLMNAWKSSSLFVLSALFLASRNSHLAQGRPLEAAADGLRFAWAAANDTSGHQRDWGLIAEMLQECLVASREEIPSLEFESKMRQLIHAARHYVPASPPLP
jgi:hypothetical protein